MRLTFYGACQTVTGSQHLLEVNGKKILLECGFWQGRRQEMERLNRSFPFDPKSLSAVILSHAHIDHSGNLPNLVKQGFAGTIYATPATVALAAPMLEDAAAIQLHDVDYLNRHLPPGNQPLEPLYRPEDVAPALKLFFPINYHTWFEPVNGARVFFHDAGHVLGSALVTLELEEKIGDPFSGNGPGKVRLGFSGDLGRPFLPILRDPEQLQNLDYLICESTYGDRLHEQVASSYADLARLINKTYQRGGKVIIPSFALERAQELLYIIHELMDRRSIPEIFVYVDSPLTVKISEIFAAYENILDEETRRLFLSRGKDPFIFPTLRFVESAADSQKLNNLQKPCIIITASGMCEFGRVRHHLKNSLGDAKNTVIIVGFMAENTLGRRLLDGARRVNILGQSLAVRAEIALISSLSAHADQQGLKNFIRQSGQLKKLFLVHGEKNAMTSLARQVRGGNVRQVIMPATGDSYQL